MGVGAARRSRNDRESDLIELILRSALVALDSTIIYIFLTPRSDYFVLALCITSTLQSRLTDDWNISVISFAIFH